MAVWTNAPPDMATGQTMLESDIDAYRLATLEIETHMDADGAVMYGTAGGGSVPTPTTVGTSPSNFLTLAGTIAVPAWAQFAEVVFSCYRIAAASAGSMNTTARPFIGTALGTSRRILTDGTTATMSYTQNDRFSVAAIAGTTVSAGLQASFTSGTAIAINFFVEAASLGIKWA